MRTLFRGGGSEPFPVPLPTPSRSPCSTRCCVWDRGVTGAAREGSQPGGSLLHTEELSQWLSWTHRARIGMNILEKVLPCQIWRDDYLGAWRVSWKPHFACAYFPPQARSPGPPPGHGPYASGSHLSPCVPLSLCSLPYLPAQRWPL